MKRFLFVLIGLFPVYSLMAQKTDLQSCISAAIEHNAMTTNTGLIAEQYRLQGQMMEYTWFPQLFLNAQGSYQSDVISLDFGMELPGLVLPEIPHFQFKTSVDLQQVVYDGGMIKAQKLINDREESLNQVAINQIKYQVRQAVEAVYMSVIKLAAQLPILALQKETLMSLMQDVGLRIESGMALETDQDLIQVGLLELDLQQQNLNAMIHAQIEVLVLLTGLRIHDHEELILPVLGDKSVSVVNRPELALILGQQEVLSARSQFTRHQRNPVVTAFSQAGYGRPGLNMLNENPDFFFIGGLRASWQLYDWKKTVHQQDIIEIQTEMLQNQHEQFLIDLEAKAIILESSIDQFLERIRQDEEIIQLYEKVSANAKAQYDGGVILLSDYIQQLNQLKAARQKLEADRSELADLYVQLNTLRYAN